MYLALSSIIGDIFKHVQKRSDSVLMRWYD